MIYLLIALACIYIQINFNALYYLFKMKKAVPTLSEILDEFLYIGMIFTINALVIMICYIIFSRFKINL